MRAAAWFLAGTMLLACTACQGSEPESSEVGDGRQGKGRYVETTMGKPDTAWVQALAVQDDRLIALGGNGLFQSLDGGENWERMDIATPELQEAMDTYAICSGCITEEGEIIFSTLSEEDGTMDEKTGTVKSIYRYYLLDKDGNQRQLPIQLPDDPPATTGEDVGAEDGPSEEGSADEEEVVTGSSTTVTVGEEDGTVYYEPPANAPQKMMVGPDGTLLIGDIKNCIHQFDLETGEILHTLYSDTPCDSFAVVGNTLVAGYFDGAGLYDMDTWEKKDPDPVLNQFLTGRIPEGEEDLIKLNSENLNEAYIGEGPVLLFGSEEENIVYISGRNGLYRHPLGGTSVEQLVMGGLTSMGDPSCNIEFMVKTGGNSFLACCDSSQGGTGFSILRYHFDPEMDATPANELNAFLVYENTSVRQAIATYQKAHPDVLINMEIAQGFSEATPLSDSLRVLNANIMAGKGPDLFFLDDMPVDNYIEKGILTDLSDLVDEACQEEELFENIVRAYTRDGKLCAVPTGFDVPMLVAPQDKLPQLDSLEALAAAVEEQRAAHPYSEQNSICGLVWPYMALDRLYDVCAPSWLQEDGTLNQEKLREFLLAAKRIYDAESTGRPENDGTMFYSNSFGLMGADILTGVSAMEVGAMIEPSGYNCLKTVLDKVEGYGYAPLKGQVENVFIPKGLVGIGAKSQHQEVAQDFVRFMLTNQNQENAHNCLPVGIPALKKLSNAGSYTGISVGASVFGQDGQEFNIQYRDLTPVEENELVELLEGLDTPAYQDIVMRNAVIDPGVNMLMGEMDLDAAVEEIMSKVNLYLSES